MQDTVQQRDTEQRLATLGNRLAPLVRPPRPSNVSVDTPPLRTEAARAMVGASTAALYATLIVASQIYGLIPAMLAVGLSLLVGSLATALAIRWAGRAIGALGLVGGLLSPVLVGASPSLATIAILALACACAMAVVIRQRWSWLGLT